MRVMEQWGTYDALMEPTEASELMQDPVVAIMRSDPIELISRQMNPDGSNYLVSKYGTLVVSQTASAREASCEYAPLTNRES